MRSLKRQRSLAALALQAVFLVHVIGAIRG
jgi:hypothetical protein